MPGTSGQWSRMISLPATLAESIITQGQALTAFNWADNMLPASDIDTPGEAQSLHLHRRASDSYRLRMKGVATYTDPSTFPRNTPLLSRDGSNNPQAAIEVLGQVDFANAETAFNWAKPLINAPAVDNQDIVDLYIHRDTNTNEITLSMRVEEFFNAGDFPLNTVLHRIIP